jgi:hypothetical protein
VNFELASTAEQLLASREAVPCSATARINNSPFQNA